MFSFGYFIDVQVCILILCLFYFIVLHRRIGFTFSRIYLLLAMPAALLIPLLDLPLLPDIKVILPAVAGPGIAQAAGSYEVVESSESTLWLLYLAGAVLTGGLTLLSILRSVADIRRKKYRIIDGRRVIFSPNVPGAYSVFGVIFVHTRYADTEWLDYILVHEGSHIRRRHSTDLLWMNLWRIACWFNPFVWYMLHLLREVHEFEADSEVLSQGGNIHKYVGLLIESEAGIYSGVATPLRYSLTKKRIRMMAGSPPQKRLYRALLTVPVLALLLLTFSVTARVVVEEYTPSFPLRLAHAEPESLQEIAPIEEDRPADLSGLPLQQDSRPDEPSVSGYSQATFTEIAQPESYPSEEEMLPENEVSLANPNNEEIIAGMMANFLEQLPQENTFQTPASASVPAPMTRYYPKEAEPANNRQENMIVINTHHDDPLEEFLPDIITIRQQDRQPLYVVDGVIVNEANRNLYSALSAEDYESITILKNRDATKLYGQEGRGGAIVITTRNIP